MAPWYTNCLDRAPTMLYNKSLFASWLTCRSNIFYLIYGSCCSSTLYVLFGCIAVTPWDITSWERYCSCQISGVTSISDMFRNLHSNLRRSRNIDIAYWLRQIGSSFIWIIARLSLVFDQKYRRFRWIDNADLFFLRQTVIVFTINWRAKNR